MYILLLICGNSIASTYNSFRTLHKNAFILPFIHMNNTYTYLKAIADLTRLRISSLIHAMPNICVCQLMEIMELPQTTISKALGVLKRSGLVEDRRDGQWVRYKIATPDNKFPLKHILSSTTTDPSICKDLKKLQKIKKIPLDKICCNKPWRK